MAAPTRPRYARLMSEANPEVAEHYRREAGDLGNRILAALQAAGKDIDHLTPDDLAPVDQFHTRGLAATVDLATLLKLRGDERVLDVGSGLGGPSRYLAHRFRVAVTGIDLTPEFVVAATMLAERTGLAGRVRYRQGNALALPFEDESFDVVWSQNVAMNIADRDRLYGEMRRVLRPGGRLALNEILAGAGGTPHFPVAWARTPATSFLFNAEAMQARLQAAGFRLLEWQDTSAAALEFSRKRAAAGPSPLGIHVVMGADWPAMSANMARNFAEDRVRAMNAVLERMR